MAGRGWRVRHLVIARSEATKHFTLARLEWIALRSLSSGAHSRDPLARNDDAAKIVARMERSEIRGLNVAPVPDVAALIRATVLTLPLAGEGARQRKSR
jgi:hypothetical protein